MNIRRRKLLAGGMGLIGLPAAAPVQAQTAKMARIGCLINNFSKDTIQLAYVEQLRGGLKDLGYMEGKHFELVFRWSEGVYDRLPELARELVRLNADVIMTAGTPGTLAAMRATATTPIVMTLVGDAVAAGIVPSLAHPGGNVTGGTFFLPELCAKRLQLLKEAIPRVTQVATLVQPENLASFGPVLEAMTKAAGILGITLHRFDVRRVGDLDDAFSLMASKRVDALAIIDDSFMSANASPIALFTTKHRLPSIGYTETVEAGGLMAYGVDRRALWRRSAYFVDKILKGAKPADIPVEQPIRFEMIVNQKTAKAMGITFPPAILLRVDRMIE